MSSWGSSIVNAAKKTAKDQIWPVTTIASAVGGGLQGASIARETANQNKANAHIKNVANVHLPVKNVAKTVVSTAVKTTGIGLGVTLGVNFGYRLGQERGWWK
ncbi:MULTISPECIES: hypothetical protein [Lysinibacillus]|uniref:DUF4235 domain-containing protein n=2 Tax=Lysinibacillus TaxID=400634 RepID=A0ABY2TFL5_9BACI|nr:MULTISPECIES: hypothetical protein [Lysinibacillus]AHN24127.1 hypothetical protein T479_09880 [Lysinibacillus varians]TKI47525.1 hypothetical protein FC748_07625 [Lysinibacillus tabacifolii]TKI67580.1 hypothetical protein FC752_00920 [Lysinibacillus varians]